MSEIEVILRLIIATILGAVIGYERENFHKPAGLRTHVFVSMGSALFTLIGLLLAEDAPVGIIYDATRIIAAIVSGVGFLGAGIIIHRSDHHVEGITTAAGLWVASGIGVAVGLGYYLVSINTVLISLVVLLGLSRLKPKG